MSVLGGGERLPELDNEVPPRGNDQGDSETKKPSFLITGYIFLKQYTTG